MLTQFSAAWASNPPIPGSGCVDAGTSDTLGSTPDYLSTRKMVSVGVDASTPMLKHLESIGQKASMDEFLKPRGLAAKQMSEQYVLLVGQGYISWGGPTELAALMRAKAMGVPIVMEGFRKAEFKTLTGLGLESDAAVVQFAPGGRAQTVTLIRQPPHGATLKSSINAVDRAIDKHEQAQGNPTLTPARQAYAEYIWTVWLHTGNIVCTLPYYAPEDVYYPQTGNLDFGVQITLVASLNPSNKVIDLQYTGAGFSPLSPGVETIDYNDYFKGALTLDTTYSGSLAARPSAHLNGNASQVQPQTIIGAHTVAKTNGFSYGLTSSCGGNVTGPNCSISASFGFSSSTQYTDTIAERVINASYSFGNVADPDGTICGDVTNGCVVSDQGIGDYLSSAASSENGGSINLLNNDWDNFFNTSGWDGPISSNYGDALFTSCYCDSQNPPLLPGQTVYDFPQWSFSSALTEGEAGYTFDPNFTGDLFLTSSVTGEEGIFSIGVGSKENRMANGYENGINLDPNTAFYALDLYTDSYTSAADITIDANQVNFSGMPTCAARQYTQKDLGIYQILNMTSDVLNIGSLVVPVPAKLQTFPTVADDYRGSDEYVLGVSATTIQPGQYEYVALCSSNQTDATGIGLEYSNTATYNVSNAIYFSFAGQPTYYNTSNITYDPTQRLFTISNPNGLSSGRLTRRDRDRH